MTKISWPHIEPGHINIPYRFDFKSEPKSLAASEIQSISVGSLQQPRTCYPNNNPNHLLLFHSFCTLCSVDICRWRPDREFGFWFFWHDVNLAKYNYIDGEAWTALFFVLPDLLQPQGQQNHSWRCVCTGKSFPSEPESSEAQARVSSAIQFFFQSCAEIVCDTWKHLHGWLCAFLTHDHSSNKSSPFVTNNWMYISNVVCLTTRNQLCSFIFVFFLVYYCKCIQASTHLD